MLLFLSGFRRPARSAHLGASQALLVPTRDLWHPCAFQFLRSQGVRLTRKWPVFCVDGRNVPGHVGAVTATPHSSHPRTCSLSEAISEAVDMKEAMETMPETLEYGVINAHVLPLLKDVICQVRAGGEGSRRV